MGRMAESVKGGRKPPPRPHTWTKPHPTVRKPTAVTRQRQHTMSGAEHLEIEEYDEAGNVVTMYITSGDSRVDVVVRAFPSLLLLVMID
jgi:hypothetical protein